MESKSQFAWGRYHRLVVLFVSGLPALGTICLIRFFGTKALVLDEWGLTYFFQKLKEGSLLLNVVWSANHEHRLVFPRLFFGLVAVLTRWDPRVVMYCSVIVLLIGWLAFVGSFTGRFALNGRWSIPILLLCSLILFGPAQQENWLWAFQFAFFLILACELVAIAVMMNEHLDLVTRLVAIVSLCIVASFSSAHGLFSWAVLFPLVLVACLRRRWGWLVVLGWLLLAIGVWTIYLNGLDLSHTGGLKSFLARPWATIKFGLELIGNPFVGATPEQIRPAVARIVGTVNLFLAFFPLYLLIRKIGWAATAPLFSFLLIGLLPWVSVSLGRLESEQQLISGSKYDTTVIPIALSVLLELYLLGHQWNKADSGLRKGTISSDRKTRKTVTILLPFAFIFLLTGYLWSFPDSIAEVPSGAETERVVEQFSMFGDCLDERINGNADPSPESKVFNIPLTGLFNRVGMRLLAGGGYRSLIENPVFAECTSTGTGTITQLKQSLSKPDRFPIVDVSGSYHVLSGDRFSPFVFVTNTDGSKIIGAQYLPTLQKAKSDENLPWLVTVPLSLCRIQDQKIELSGWVYDKNRKMFCLIGRGELAVPN